MGWGHTGEAFFGPLTAGAFIVMALVVGFVSIYMEPENLAAPDRLWRWLLWGAAVLAEVPFFWWVQRAYERRAHPLPPRLALAQPRWPLLVRPLAAAWWLAHWGAVILLADFLYDRMRLVNADWETFDPLAVALWVLRVLLAFGGAYAANVFLLLAVGAVRPGSGLIDHLWRWRVALDAVIVVVLILLPPPWPV